MRGRLKEIQLRSWIGHENVPLKLRSYHWFIIINENRWLKSKWYFIQFE